MKMFCTLAAMPPHLDWLAWPIIALAVWLAATRKR
jgi:hypothetical protein